MTASEPFVFDAVARVPSPGDNVAITLQTLAAGSRILIRQLVFEFAHTVLEGHRFALHRIRKGEALLSWGLPFGLASRDIEPGEYVCNESMLKTLAERSVELVLPKAPNFTDHRLKFQLDEAKFRPGIQVRSDRPAPSFMGFWRGEPRGAGTRNYIVILGTNSQTAGFVRSVASRFEHVRRRFPNVDGVVAVDHTEGGSNSVPQNFALTLRTLAGFMVNPNVGAILCVDFGHERLSNRALDDYLRKHRYPTTQLLHASFSIGSSYEEALNRAEKQVNEWLPVVNALRRAPLPISHLRIGLQCGGSDAFSGISANPLVGILSRETVAFGGSANLAETDELIGAERYVLENVRDLETARAFLRMTERFQEWASWHGHSAEGNPSGGNRFRGLYNIAIKSIGAARKKDPATRLDYVIDFGEPMLHPGFSFMNSPGNDLESIAGQVASGCNLILFATGNGSITNFPFVPTIKVMTTTRRFELVRHEMDFNAGRYLDGEPLESLGAEAFQQMIEIASGAASAGERAGHSQVQLWREWRGRPPGSAVMKGPEAILPRAPQAKEPIQVPPELLVPAAPPRVALVLPTSLCSGQIASMIARQLNAEPHPEFARAVALSHTEGCGNSAGESERLFLRTMAGYLAHPFVAKAVLLEHGCEKTHNDAFRHALRDLHMDASRYGYASIQLDGGIERVCRKVLQDFVALPTPKSKDIPFSIGFALQNDHPREIEIVQTLIRAFAQCAITTVAPAFLILDANKLQYGERFCTVGTFGMQTPTHDLIEIVTGLAATGVEMVLAFSANSLVPANPLVPTLQIAVLETDGKPSCGDVDIIVPIEESLEQSSNRILALMADIRSRRREPRSGTLGNYGFQITRGYTGISL